MMDMKSQQIQVYGLLLGNINDGSERLALTIANTLDDALKITHESMRMTSLGFNKSDWILAHYQSISITPVLLNYLNQKTIKLDSEIKPDNVIRSKKFFDNITPIEKPIDTYINSLKYAADKYGTPLQKRTINTLIRKIKKQNGTRISKA